MCSLECRQEGHQAFLVLHGVIELIGVGPTVRADSGCLAAPDQFCAGGSEMRPAAQHQVSRLSIRRGAPTLHGVSGEPVADRTPVHTEGLRQWILFRGEQFIIAGHCDGESGEVLLEGGHALK
jgi:hypothetical protein